MKIGIIGSGRIGGTVGKLFAKAGHQVLWSWSRDPEKLQALAHGTPGGRTGTPAEAVAFGDVVFFAVRFPHVGQALGEAGPIDQKVFIDACNPYGNGGLMDLGGRTESEVVRALVPSARYVKAFNTLTARFQGEAAGRSGVDRVVMFLSGDDRLAKRLVADLITDIGFDPYDLGSIAESRAQEPGGAYYGEEFHLADLAATSSTMHASS